MFENAPAQLFMTAHPRLTVNLLAKIDVKRSHISILPLSHQREHLETLYVDPPVATGNVMAR